MRVRCRTPLLLLLLAPGGVLAQDAPLAGRAEESATVLVRVSDRTTVRPISSARVVFRRISDEGAESWEGTSGENGSFITPRLRLGDYEVSAEMIGYSRVVDRVTFDREGDVDLTIEMVPEAVPLDPVLVAVRRTSRLETVGFFERQLSQIGYFMNRIDIEQRGASRVAEIFYAVPGARVLPATMQERAQLVLLRNECVPLIVLDGSPISNRIRLDELLHISDIEAIEVYHGPSAPVQFSPFTTCGTIMIWTRETRLLEGRPLTWRRFFAAMGVLAGLFLIGR